MIGIIDYGSGNVQAIATIYKKLNINYIIISDSSIPHYPTISSTH